MGSNNTIDFLFSLLVSCLYICLPSSDWNPEQTSVHHSQASHLFGQFIGEGLHQKEEQVVSLVCVCLSLLSDCCAISSFLREKEFEKSCMKKNNTSQTQWLTTFEKSYVRKDWKKKGIERKIDLQNIDWISLSLKQQLKRRTEEMWILFLLFLLPSLMMISGFIAITSLTRIKGYGTEFIGLVLSPNTTEQKLRSYDDDSTWIRIKEWRDSREKEK